MAALKQITSLTKVFKVMTASRSNGVLASKNYYTYSNEPGMPIPDKEPCWVQTAEEAIEKAGLTSGRLPSICVFYIGIYSFILESIKKFEVEGIS